MNRTPQGERLSQRGSRSHTALELSLTEKSQQVGWGIGLDSERRVLRTEDGKVVWEVEGAGNR